MDWADKVNLQDYCVTVTPFGGTIAVFRDEKKLTGSQPNSKPTILLFSPHGELRNSVKVLSNNS